MPTVVEQLIFTPALTSQGRRLATWATDPGLNVKNFGATGDGTTDDASAIQACLNAAYGSYSAPHGNANNSLNRAVFFPAGHYKVGTTLNMKSVVGPCIMGAGSGCTQLTYTGTVSGTPYTPLIHTNGFRSGIVSGLTFAMTGSADANKTIAFDWNWDNAGDTNSTAMIFYDCQFRDATIGLGCAVPYSSFFQQCDASLILGCRFDNCFVGMLSTTGNALGNTVIGGTFTNCLSSNGAININGGQSISGVLFDGNNTDLFGINGSLPVLGCHSRNNTNRAFANAAWMHLRGCHHEGSGIIGPGGATPTWYVLDACVSPSGVFDTAGARPTEVLYIRGKDAYGNANYLTAFGGTIGENI